MKFSIPLLFSLFIIIVSCEKKLDNPIIRTQKKEATASEKRKPLKIVLNPTTKKELKNWKEYQLVDEILSNFSTLSNEEALSNAKELSEFVTHLKDSIVDKRLKSPPLRSRINILHNECLRLNDMASIPAISSKEVRTEIVNIIEAYSAFNAKLNAVFEVRNIENQLELDPDFEKILNDSTHKSKIEKIDFESITKSKKKTKRTKMDLLKRNKDKAIQTIR